MAHEINQSVPFNIGEINQSGLFHDGGIWKVEINQTGPCDFSAVINSNEINLTEPVDKGRLIHKVIKSDSCDEVKVSIANVINQPSACYDSGVIKT